MSPTTLTDEDIEAVENRLRERRMRESRVPDPMPPTAGTWEHAKMLHDEERRQERLAAAKALEAEQIAEERRRREEWERGRPAREAEELLQAERDLAAHDAQREQLLAKVSELKSVVNQ